MTNLSGIVKDFFSRGFNVRGFRGWTKKHWYFKCFIAQTSANNHITPLHTKTNTIPSQILTKYKNSIFKITYPTNLCPRNYSLLQYNDIITLRVFMLTWQQWYCSFSQSRVYDKFVLWLIRHARARFFHYYPLYWDFRTVVQLLSSKLSTWA